MEDSSNFHVDKMASPSFSALEELREEKKIIIRYKECLKNHAAAIGGNATDGCGEFMGSGEEGTLEAFKCSACNCHRNFHRKEIEYYYSNSHYCPNFQYYDLTQIKPISIFDHLSPNKTNGSNLSDQRDEEDVEKPDEKVMRKRFRTKFSPEQKEKMLMFSEKAGWRMQKLEESEVQQFCQEIGIKRRVLKVWMHNNKNTCAKRNLSFN